MPGFCCSSFFDSPNYRYKNKVKGYAHPPVSQMQKCQNIAPAHHISLIEQSSPTFWEINKKCSQRTKNNSKIKKFVFAYDIRFSGCKEDILKYVS